MLQWLITSGSRANSHFAACHCKLDFRFTRLVQEEGFSGKLSSAKERAEMSDKLVCVDDYFEYCRGHASKDRFDFWQGASMNGDTFANNVAAFSK